MDSEGNPISALKAPDKAKEAIQDYEEGIQEESDFFTESYSISDLFSTK